MLEGYQDNLREGGWIRNDTLQSKLKKGLVAFKSVNLSIDVDHLRALCMLQQDSV